MNTKVMCAHDALVDPRKLKKNPQNPNKHPDEQIEMLAKIIEGQGWRAPIVVSNRSGLIVKGHGRLAAALRLACDEVPVDYQDYDSEEAEHADLIADNRIAELAEMNDAALKDLLESIDTGSFDMDLTGYTAEQLEDMFTAAPPPEKKEPEEPEPNAEVECPCCGHVFAAKLKISEK